MSRRSQAPFRAYFPSSSSSSETSGCHIIYTSAPAPSRCAAANRRSATKFLHYYYVGFTVLVQPSDFEALASAYLRRAASDGVRHAELFFDPQPHLARGASLAAIVPAFQAAQQRARAELGITSLLTPCLLRHLPVADGHAAFRALRDGGYYASGALAGLGLCSTELDRPPADWAPIFAEAAAAGIRRTVHAGEEGPAAYVTAALDELGAQRIDHGVNSAQDPAVVERLARDGVLLTVCPLSNVRLGGFPSVAEVPIPLFLEKGVRFSINSDDPAYFGGYLLDNYCAVQEAFGLGVEVWEGIVRNALEGSWCDEGRKKEIRGEIESVFADWRADKGLNTA